MSVKKLQDIVSSEIQNGNDTYIQVLISAQEAPHFAMRRFVIKPGGNIPLHTNSLEHEQFVLAGKAKLNINHEFFVVESGDVIFIPEGVPHSYLNLGDDDYEFLCIIPNQKDKKVILEKIEFNV